MWGRFEQIIKAFFTWLVQVPLIASLTGMAAVVIEWISDGMSWAYMQLGLLAARGMGKAISALEVPAQLTGFSWGTFGAQAIRLIDFYQVDLAVGIVLTAALLRIVLKAVTLGQY